MRSFWKCPKCFGTGRRIYGSTAVDCHACGGTGNGFVDGNEVAHRKRLEEIDANQKEFQEALKP